MCCLRNQVDKGKFEAPSWRGVKLCWGTANARVYSRPLGVHGRQLRSCPSPKPLVGDLGMRVFLSCLKSYPPFTVLVHSCVFHLSAWIFVGVLSLWVRCGPIVRRVHWRRREQNVFHRKWFAVIQMGHACWLVLRQDIKLGLGSAARNQSSASTPRPSSALSLSLLSSFPLSFYSSRFEWHHTLLLA